MLSFVAQICICWIFCIQLFDLYCCARVLARDRFQLPEIGWGKEGERKKKRGGGGGGGGAGTIKKLKEKNQLVLKRITQT